MSNQPTTTTTSPPIGPGPGPGPVPAPAPAPDSIIVFPRIVIKYCTQCKWMLRAAYYAQEILSTFGTGIGEVALVPTTGGIFSVAIVQSSSSGAGAGSSSGSGSGSGSGDRVSDGETRETETLLWDRKRDGGFPEVKVLKSRVRNVVDPSRDLGHTDRALRAAAATATATATPAPASTLDPVDNQTCQDCQ
ncbi:hypothetical protein P175DRAFT_0168635 [Aspergillus ochraceoroseus IBT 24754]|uniref:Selenoprotein W-like protein n=1 Tax=Aspergillus ochraceoroseus IBT 24754 TaxID=1392256 RepID=A0A2T5M496_9EURO|nr:uncharacterized protein P175DRAFT_0168635 [Aspergillus ochraceoroseus IBT 24754]PTU23360.1 hypothetical protein P175DRAFT_0168635 [Aspergillus ochraceoroseus IBT 24754]